MTLNPNMLVLLFLPVTMSEHATTTPKGQESPIWAVSNEYCTLFPDCVYKFHRPKETPPKTMSLSDVQPPNRIQAVTEMSNLHPQSLSNLNKALQIQTVSSLQPPNPGQSQHRKFELHPQIPSKNLSVTYLDPAQNHHVREQAANAQIRPTPCTKAARAAAGPKGTISTSVANLRHES